MEELLKVKWKTSMETGVGGDFTMGLPEKGALKILRVVVLSSEVIIYFSQAFLHYFWQNFYLFLPLLYFFIVVVV